MKIGAELPPIATKTPATPEAQREQAERVKAAHEFEQIFLRKMLSSLEKTGHAKTDGAVSSGSDVYSSMVVGALADAISAGGGIGLADLIVRSTTPKPTSPPATAAPPSTGPPSSRDLAATPLVNEADDFRDRLKLPVRRP
jgi:Rod binding domain-containing protein